MATIPFNIPHLTGEELDNIQRAVGHLQLSANGAFTGYCQDWLKVQLGASQVLLTHSCTAALEMAMLLAGIGPGDEVIMPSFTFASTANAVVLRGGVPVFVDVRPDTLNLDEDLIEAAITPRTRAICPVHYAGVGANMSAIGQLAREYGLLVIEDAAQGMFASRLGRPLGTIGNLGAVSFHETKNIISGEGGALIINDPSLIEQARLIWEKGTDRTRFRQGHIDQYTWQTVGSSFAPSEIIAAFLWAQLQHGEEITAQRRGKWDYYQAAFAELEKCGTVRRPEIPCECEHNGHLYRLILQSAATRSSALAELGRAGIQSIFHYVPLHTSPAGRRYGRAHGALPVTENSAARLIRLPLHARLTEAEQSYIVDTLYRVCRDLALST